MKLFGQFRVLRVAMLAVAVASFSTITVDAVAESKVAVVDTIKVIAASNAQKRAVNKLKKKETDARAEVEKMEKPLEDRRRKLENSRSMMTDEKFQQAVLELRSEQRMIQTKVQSLQDEIQQEVLRLRKEINTALLAVVDEIAKSKGYDVVINKNQALFAADAVDISDPVLEALNKRLDK